MADFTVNGNINDDDINRSDVESALKNADLLSTSISKEMEKTFEALNALYSKNLEVLKDQTSAITAAFNTPANTEEQTTPESIVKQAAKISKEVQTSSLSTTAKSSQEPAKLEGYVRVYHSGAPLSQESVSGTPESSGEKSEGPSVTTSRKTVSSNKEPLYFLDLPESDSRLKNPEYRSKDSDQGFVFNFKLTPEESQKLRKISKGLEEDVFNEPFESGKNPLSQSSEKLLKSAEKLSKSSESLEDLSSDVYNNLFQPPPGGDGGDGGQPPTDGGGLDSSDDGEESSKNINMVLNALGKGNLANKLTKGAAVGTVVTSALNSVKSFVAMYTDLAKNMANVYTQGLSSPQSVSPIGTILQPAQSAANTAGPVAGLTGAAIGTAIAPGIGTVLGGMIGTALGSQFSGAISDIINTLVSIDNGIANLSSDLRAFNVELMSATVEANIAKLESRFQQANELGPLLAENVRARSQFELAVRGLVTDLSRLFLPLLTRLTQAATILVEVVRVGFNEVLDFAKEVLGFLSKLPVLNNIFGPLAQVANGIDLIANILGNRQKPVFSARMQRFMQMSAMGGNTRAAWWNQGNRAPVQNVGSGPQIPFIPGAMGITF